MDDLDKEFLRFLKRYCIQTSHNQTGAFGMVQKHYEITSDLLETNITMTVKIENPFVIEKMDPTMVEALLASLSNQIAAAIQSAMPDSESVKRTQS